MHDMEIPSYLRHSRLELQKKPARESSDTNGAVMFLLGILGIAMMFGFDWVINYSLERWGGI